MAVSATRSAQAISANFWTDSQLAAIHTMLHPRSIAVIGATPRLQYGGRLLNALLRAGDRLHVYPVKPKYGELGGVKCYPGVEDLPESPDLAAVIVPQPQVLPVLETTLGDVTTRVRGMQPIEFDVQIPFSFDTARLHLFDATTGESVLRPGASSSAVKPFRSPVARVPSLVSQTQSG
jgi:predicted CoA-binding protein